MAVIGGGAIGVEAALYARFLGYYVLLIEAAKMAQTWRTGAHLPMLTTFGQAASRLGIAALEAHRPDTQLPDANATLTGLEFAEKYLVPLARTDLLYESVQVHSQVMSVSRLRLGANHPRIFRIERTLNIVWRYIRRNAAGIPSEPILCWTAVALVFRAGSVRAVAWPWADRTGILDRYRSA